MIKVLQIKSGYTLIELIVVITIIGILAGVAIPIHIGISDKAHEANIKAIEGMLNAYAADLLAQTGRRITHSATQKMGIEINIDAVYGGL